MPEILHLHTKEQALALFNDCQWHNAYDLKVFPGTLFALWEEGKLESQALNPHNGTPRLSLFRKV